jgi:hypothetical protein
MPQRIDGLTMLPSVSLPMRSHQSGGGGGARAGAGAGRAFFQQPRVHGLAAEPDVVERQRAHAQLGDQHGARLVQALDHGGVLRGHAIAVRLGAVGGRDAGGIDQILGAPRDAVQRAAILSGGDLHVGLFGLRQRQVARERDDAAQLGVEALQAVQIDIGEALGGELARLDHFGPRRRSGAERGRSARSRFRRVWPVRNRRRLCVGRGGCAQHGGGGRDQELATRFRHVCLRSGGL